MKVAVFCLAFLVGAAHNWPFPSVADPTPPNAQLLVDSQLFFFTGFYWVSVLKKRFRFPSVLSGSTLESIFTEFFLFFRKEDTQL